MSTAKTSRNHQPSAATSLGSGAANDVVDPAGQPIEHPHCYGPKKVYITCSNLLNHGSWGGVIFRDRQ